MHHSVLAIAAILPVIAATVPFTGFVVAFAVKVVREHPLRLSARARLRQRERLRQTALLEADLGIVTPTDGSCTHCTRPLQIGARFCMYCGRATDEKARVCENCYTTASHDARYCPQCGIALIAAPSIVQPGKAIMWRTIPQRRD